MHVTRTRGRRLSAAAVTLALAATGGTLTALPATAAVAAPGATQEAGQTTVPFPRDADVVGAGPSGFLTKTRGQAPSSAGPGTRTARPSSCPGPPPSAEAATSSSPATGSSWAPA